MFLRGKKEDIKYDIDLFDDGSYELEFSFEIDNAVLKAAVESMKKQQEFLMKINEEFDKLDYFIVDQRYYGIVEKGMRKLVKKVEREVRQDIRGFRIVSGKIDVIAFQRTDSKTWMADIRMRGEYVT